MVKSIDPTHLSKKKAKALANYIAEGGEIALLEKKKIYGEDEQAIQLTHHLILDQAHHDAQIKRYHVVSQKREEVLGTGASSKVRTVLGYVDVDVISKEAQFTPSDEKALKIKNTKAAQIQHRLKGSTYSHKQAKSEFATSENFPQLGMQKPIKVKRDRSKSGLGLFAKSYFLVNRLEGRDLNLAVEDFIGYERPTTVMMIEKVLLPVLLAYKEQIADKGLVHRDIKPENIRAKISLEGDSKITFLDIEGCIRQGEEDKLYGTAGYHAPELASTTLKASPARDIFALGVMLTGCINPDLNPTYYFTHQRYAKNPEQTVGMAYFQIKENGCYDSDKMTDRKGRHYELFENMEETEMTAAITDARDQVKLLLKQMTNINPAERPDIDKVIDVLQRALENIHSFSTPQVERKPGSP